MIQEFNTLRDDEIEILLNAPVMVAVLIAGADDFIDEAEIDGAIDFSKKKKTMENGLLSEYFKKMDDNFEDALLDYIKDLPKPFEIRQPAIISYLRQLNGILPKVDQEVSAKFYEFLLEMSETVAKSSGGILGFKKISKEEAKYIHLDMIHNPAKHEYS